MVEKCQGISKDGTPCSATPRPGRSWCAWHDPELAGQRQAWSAKGGRARSNKARARKQLPAHLMGPDELRGVLGAVLKGVIAGQLEPGIANAAANVARVMTAIHEASELESRLSVLEERAGLGDGRRMA